MQKRLRSQGFDQSYQLEGPQDKQLAQIEKALPPPIAQAFATTLYNHIYCLGHSVAAVRGQVQGNSPPGEDDPNGIQEQEGIPGQNGGNSHGDEGQNGIQEEEEIRGQDAGKYDRDAGEKGKKRTLSDADGSELNKRIRKG
jgi:hypothetical protein